MFWSYGQPHSILADEGIGENGKFPGDGDDCELWWFSCGDHALVERFHIDVEARRSEGGKIEDSPYVGATAPDDPHTLALAGLVSNRSKARKHGDLLDGAAAELRQAGEQGCGYHKADTRDRGQDSVAPGQAVIDVDALKDRRIWRCRNFTVAADRWFFSAVC